MPLDTAPPHACSRRDGILWPSLTTRQSPNSLPSRKPLTLALLNASLATVTNSAEYKEREKRRGVEWEAENAESNAAALRELAAIIPQELALGGASLADLQNVHGLSPALARRCQSHTLRGSTGAPNL